MISDLISSDESDVEDGKAVLVVKELPWRSDKVSKFFTRLDEAQSDRKSEQASRQTKRRVRNGSRSSSRPMPENLSSWIVRNY